MLFLYKLSLRSPSFHPRLLLNRKVVRYLVAFAHIRNYRSTNRKPFPVITLFLVSYECGWRLDQVHMLGSRHNRTVLTPVLLQSITHGLASLHHS